MSKKQEFKEMLKWESLSLAFSLQAVRNLRAKGPGNRDKDKYNEWLDKEEKDINHKMQLIGDIYEAYEYTLDDNCKEIPKEIESGENKINERTEK